MEKKPVSYNLGYYGEDIKRFIPDISDDDLKWLANKSAQDYKSLQDNCIDNYRVSRVVGDRGWSEEYEKVLSTGCCGFSDVLHTNQKTGNSFWIGFNYGH